MKLHKLSPKKWCLSLVALLVMMFSSLEADAHAVQVGYYVLPNGFLRVYIEHWHGDMTTQSLVGNGMSITTTYGSSSVTQNVNPTGAVNNTAWNALPFSGTGITILGKTSQANMYRDWAYYDFAPAACGVPLVITLNGGLTVVLTEADANLWPKTITGTFVDNSGPTITPVNNTATVACGSTGTNVNFSSTVVDNCTQGLTASYSIAPGSFFPVGTTNVTATSTDGNGNTTTSTIPVIVSVVDNVPPVLTSCPANMVVGNDLNSCGAVVNYALPAYSDNCGIASMSQIAGLAPGSVFPMGNTVNTFRVTDGSGNSVTCSFVITVNDVQPPTPVTKNAVVALSSNETASITVSDINNGSYDNCGPVTVSVSGQLNYTCADIGRVIPVTLTVVDGKGMISTASATVTVTDPGSYCNAAPVAVCKPLTLSAGSGCNQSANASDFDGGSTDADGDALTFTVSPAGPYAIGTTNVTLTVTDTKGASSSCSTTVTVVDNTAPTVSCPSPIAVNNDPGQCGAFVLVPAPAISDNCNVVCNTEGLDEYPAGNVTGQSPQWTVWPGGQSAVVTTERYLSAPNSLKVTGDPWGGPVDQVFKLGNQTTGNWTLSFSIYIPAGKTGYYNLQHTESLNSWAHQVKFNSDGVGVLNSNGPNTIFNYPQDQWFEVKQLINQVTDQTSLYINGVHIKTWQFSTHANSPAINNQLGAFNFFPITHSNFMGAPEPNPSATPLFYVDDITLCGDAGQIGTYVSRRYSKKYPVGTTPVAITISDMAGNKTVCNSFAVTVTDNENPWISGLSPVQVNADNGSCSATGVNLGTPATGDNCGVSGVTNDAPASYPVGATNVTWTVTDIHGNSTSLVQKVVVTDNQPPVITCTTDKFFCYAGTQYNVGMLSVSDNCGIGSLHFDITGATVRSGSGASASGLFNVGTSTITWTVTDIHGNVSTCSSTVTVNPPVSVAVPDAMAYAAGVQANTVYIGYAPAQSITISAQPAGGTAPYSYSWSNGATTSSITVSPASAGSYNYTVTITDAKGCTASFTRTITAVDVRCGNKNDKVLVCHKTTSTTNPYVQICVSANAVASHLANGSYLGACTNNAVTRTSRPSVQEASAKAVMAYPNPSRGIVNLQLKNFAAGKVNVQVVNTLGKLIISKDVNVSYLLQDETLDLQGMPAGMYQVRIVGNDGVVTTGIVIGR